MLIRPIMSGAEKKAESKKQAQAQAEEDMEEEEAEGRPSSEEDDSDSSDDEHTWTKEMKDMYRQGMYEKRQQDKAARQEAAATKVYQLQESTQTFGDQTDKKKEKKRSKLTLGERVELEDESGKMERGSAVRGNLQMSYESVKKITPKDIKRKEEMAEHRRERKKVRRSAGQLSKGPRGEKFQHR